MAFHTSTAPSSTGDDDSFINNELVQLTTAFDRAAEQYHDTWAVLCVNSFGMQDTDHGSMLGVDPHDTRPFPQYIDLDDGAGRRAVLAQSVLSGSSPTNEPIGRRKLPECKPHDRQAWRLSLLHGMTQLKVAMALNEEYGTKYSQGQVCRMIARAKRHAEASGLAELLPSRMNRARAVDPARLELGARVDKRPPRPSDLTRADDDGE